MKKKVKKVKNLENNVDNIARVKGFSVNLDEITNAINSISSVKMCVTTIFNIANINYICSYVVVKSPITKEAIREFLNSILPYYMIPAYIIFLDNLPMDSQGNIMYNLLPPPLDFDIIKNKEDFILPEESLDEHDFRKYDHILKNNSVKNIHSINTTPIGDVLLTGVTKPLGIYILVNYLKNEKGIIYCLLGDKPELTAKQRLINCLHSYFGNAFDVDIDSRIRVVRGRPSEYEFGLTEEEYDALGIQVNTVIHSAGLSRKNEASENYKIANIKGTQKIVDLCEKFHLNLIYVSTFDIFENTYNQFLEFSEQNFYIGQTLDNPYIKSKFEAEKIVLDSICNCFQSCIVRTDNIAMVTPFTNSTAVSILDLANHFNNNFSVFHICNTTKNYINCDFTQKYLNICKTKSI